MQPTTRRNVIRSAAWVAPAVVVVSAAPAFAASTTGTLTIDPGSTRYGPTPVEPEFGAYAVIFRGFTITPSVTGSGPLTLTVTKPSGFDIYDDYTPAAPSLWTRIGSPVFQETTLVYRYDGVITAGQPIAFGPSSSEAVYFDDQGERSTMVLTFQASGFNSQSVSYGPR